ncbi:right-handed parallel beta-helix repeat-containing protein [Thermodesulfobacteriota bacterium]
MAAPIYVPADHAKIQDAINASSAGDLILVSPGTYVENITIPINITIRSTAGAATTTIDGNSANSVVRFGSGTSSGAVIDGFTITNGSAFQGGGVKCYPTSSPTITNCIISNNVVTGTNAEGAGIHIDAGSYPTITNCTIKDNNAGFQGFGGGIYCYNSTSSPTITNCIISNNSAKCGAGIYTDLSSPTITNCTIKDNAANSDGGGIQCYESTPTITNCTITGNSAAWYGGGIECAWGSTPTITGCTITGNSSKIGAGIDTFNASPTISSCTVTDNTATWNGGGMYIAGTDNGTPVNIDNCIISDNQAQAYNGGGIQLDSTIANITYCTLSNNTASGYSSGNGGGVASYDADTTILNSIIWGNVATANNEIYVYGTFGFVNVSNSDVAGGYTGAGNISTDPLFVDPNNLDVRLRNYHIQPTSPCINIALRTGLFNYDIDGDPREVAGCPPGGPTCVPPAPNLRYPDMGADEWKEDNALSVPAEYITIQSAIDAAINGETVRVTNGTYFENIDFKGKQITVRSANGAANTIINGSASGSVVTFNSGETTLSLLEGFTIQNGNVTNGGGLYIYSASPTIQNCTISLNVATSGGGGVWISHGDPTFNTVIIEDNYANHGAGIWTDLSDVTITNSNISSNVAADLAGGIFFSNGMATFTNITMNGNTAISAAGIFACDTNTPGDKITITGGTVTDNIATSCGGGIMIANADALIEGVTISNNIAGDLGGGIFYSNGMATFTNLTMNGNTAISGAGIFACDTNTPGDKITITGGTVTDNTATSCGGGILIANADALIEDVKISNNDADNGGGIFAYEVVAYTETLDIIGCEITQNNDDRPVSNAGGGIYLDGNNYDTSIINCIIAENKATHGAGVRVGATTAANPTDIINTTFSNNISSGVGGAIILNSAYATVKNSILYGDTSSNNSEIYLENSSVTVEYSDVEGGWAGMGNINAAPTFKVSPAYHLADGSRGINEGTNSGAPLDDIDGDSRPCSSTVDMGADENISSCP